MAKSSLLENIDGFESVDVHNLGQFFRESRINSGLSIEELSGRLGDIDAQTLHSYESSETPIPLEDVYALTNTLNLSPEEVLRRVAAARGFSL
jgi:transcriptional regulator with XRE-family HTH domain